MVGVLDTQIGRVGQKKLERDIAVSGTPIGGSRCHFVSPIASPKATDAREVIEALPSRTLNLECWLPDAQDKTPAPGLFRVASYTWQTAIATL